MRKHKEKAPGVAAPEANETISNGDRKGVSVSSLAGNGKTDKTGQFDYEGPYRDWVEGGEQVPEPDHPSWCDRERCFYAGAGQWCHSRRFEDEGHWAEVLWLEHTPFGDRKISISDTVDMNQWDALVRARLLLRAASFQSGDIIPEAVAQLGPLPVVVNRNAPCDVEWKGGVSASLQDRGHSVEYVFRQAMADAREDGRYRVYIDLKGSPKPTELLLAVFKPAELGSNMIGADLGYWGWKVLKKRRYDLHEGDWMPYMLGRFVSNEVASMTSEVLKKRGTPDHASVDFPLFEGGRSPSFRHANRGLRVGCGLAVDAAHSLKNTLTGWAGALPSGDACSPFSGRCGPLRERTRATFGDCFLGSSGPRKVESHQLGDPIVRV